MPSKRSKWPRSYTSRSKLWSREVLAKSRSRRSLRRARRRSPRLPHLNLRPNQRKALPRRRPKPRRSLLKQTMV